jgi:hypothetical protein
MENRKNSRKIQCLVVWLFLTNIILGVVVYRLYSSKVSVEVLTAKRIDIVGEDGDPRIVLSNEVRQHSGRMFGKDFPKRERPGGIIFFNNEGTESGGIISAVYDKGGKVNSGMSFTMDRMNNDQVIQILNNEVYDNGEEKIQRGFLVNEFPKGAKFFNLHNEYEAIKNIEDKKLQQEKILDLLKREGAKKRIYLGKSFNHETGLTLYNDMGEPQLKIYVDKTGKPKFQYLSKGKMVDLLKEKML